MHYFCATPLESRESPGQRVLLLTSKWAQRQREVLGGCGPAQQHQLSGGTGKRFVCGNELWLGQRTGRLKGEMEWAINKQTNKQMNIKAIKTKTRILGLPREVTVLSRHDPGSQRPGAFI